jgi:hypothetical protein
MGGRTFQRRLVGTR